MLVLGRILRALYSKSMSVVTQKYAGRCHCGNIVLDMVFTGEPGSFNPRSCDCDFCCKHAASYVSDPRGKLVLKVKDAANLGKYRQGSGIADFLVCRICGVLVGVCYQEHGQMYAAVNSKVVENGADFGAETAVSPKKLNDQEKIQRWKKIWFSDVSIETAGA